MMILRFPKLLTYSKLAKVKTMASIQGLYISFHILSPFYFKASEELK